MIAIMLAAFDLGMIAGSLVCQFAWRRARRVPAATKRPAARRTEPTTSAAAGPVTP